MYSIFSYFFAVIIQTMRCHFCFGLCGGKEVCYNRFVVKLRLKVLSIYVFYSITYIFLILQNTSSMLCAVQNVFITVQAFSKCNAYDTFFVCFLVVQLLVFFYFILTDIWTHWTSSLLVGLFLQFKWYFVWAIITVCVYFF